MAPSNDEGPRDTPDSSNDILASLLRNEAAEHLIQSHVSKLPSPNKAVSTSPIDFQRGSTDDGVLLAAGLAALDAFLQANVTGPVLPIRSASRVEDLFVGAWKTRGGDATDRTGALHRLRRAALSYLEVDGVSPYAHIPNIELFSLARYIIMEVLSPEAKDLIQVFSSEGATSRHSLSWASLRLRAWHYKILTQPSLGPGSNFNRSTQWIEVPSLATQILLGIENLREKIFSGKEVWADQDEEAWTAGDKALFLVEAASHYISLGRNDKASEVLREAAAETGFTYALSGALGKRTKFQENNISQLVVLARSGTKKPENKDGEDEETDAKPDALKLNDDTLLEDIHFAKDEGDKQLGGAGAEIFPPALADLSPDEQPQLDALDEIILLIEATIKDAFSPSDGLTSEQILPFAVRVITDKSVNWQIYTQALLVRSRIEIHRSRTVERGVLQLQAVADQVITDTTHSSQAPPEEDAETKDALPEIRISASDHHEAAPVDESKPTTFFPAPEQSESAPAQVRLRYIHALSSPPRWHLESELAYGWAGVGSMTSALEIFKRLRLWAEVALCLASAAASAAEDEDGRGSGGDEKAKGIIRWRLFSRTGATSPSAEEPEDEIIGQDVTLLKAADWSGPERDPPPPEAPRLWCILGDLEDDPAHYDRAWEISKRRFARAKRSLGEHYIQQKEWDKALEAYKEATRVNRLSPDMWSRLGDLNLRLGRFEEAAQAFSRSIGSATDTAGGEGARTWSNLGSALLSLYLERMAESKQQQQQPEASNTKAEEEEEEEEDDTRDAVPQDPSKLLAQALSAYKKGASTAHDNWRIWDNVLTLASRMRPLPVQDMVFALVNILRIRRSEDALDYPLLSALVQDVVLSKEKDASSSEGIYEPPRGSPERSVIRLVEEHVVPLITNRSDLWALVSRLRTWQLDHAGSLDASERAWRAAFGSSNSGPLGTSTSGSVARDWTTDRPAWEEVVKRTDELVSMLENWGPGVDSIGGKWKGKARSAVRSVMGRGREMWEGSEGWRTLEGIMEGLKA